MNNKAYEDPCWGHNCEKYSSVDALKVKVAKVYQKRKDQVLPYILFLTELGLKKSILQHWKTCKPLSLGQRGASSRDQGNLKILED